MNKSKAHNYGIDLLRLTAFMYVVVLHTLGHGGILGAAVFGSNQYKLSAALEIWAYCAVDLFGLISGYVGYRAHEDARAAAPKKRLQSYLTLWLQVVFFAVVPALIQGIMLPGSVPASELVKGFFPVTTGAYWYFTAYTGLFVLIPFLNAALSAADTRFLKGWIGLFLVIFSLYASPMERFTLREGYSTFWLVLLYLTGGAVKKLQLHAAPDMESPIASVQTIKQGQRPHLSAKGKCLCLAGIVLCTLIAWLWLLGDCHLTIFGVQIKRTTWMNYTSFTVTAAALLHLLLFSSLRVPEKLQRPLKRIASCGFGVYLLNTQPFLWKLTDGKFAALGTGPLIRILLALAANILVFMTGGILMDYARQALFDVVKRRSRTGKSK